MASHKLTADHALSSLIFIAQDGLPRSKLAKFRIYGHNFQLVDMLLLIIGLHDRIFYDKCPNLVTIPVRMKMPLNDEGKDKMSRFC